MLNKQFFKVERSNFTNQTFKWMPADTEENYKKIIQNTTVPYGPNDIDYKYNNYGFRCDNFESWKNYPYRILYAGCSMTEGVGLPLKDSWPKLLHNTICKSFNVEIPYWTIAVGGTGMDQMVRYFYNIKDFLRPQIVISYLPGLERRELYYETRWAVWNLDTVEGKNTRIFLDENLVSYQSEKNIAMLDLILTVILVLCAGFGAVTIFVFSLLFYLYWLENKK